MQRPRGFQGISFPFRFNAKGGVATSTTSVSDFSHIQEGITQILLTAKGERMFELGFGSELNKVSFSEGDEETNTTILRFYVQEALDRWDERVEIESLKTTSFEDTDNVVYTVVDLVIFVKKYMTRENIQITIK